MRHLPARGAYHAGPRAVSVFAEECQGKVERRRELAASGIARKKVRMAEGIVCNGGVQDLFYAVLARAVSPDYGCHKGNFVEVSSV
jgi:hypothetical protein